MAKKKGAKATGLLGEFAAGLIFALATHNKGGG